MADSFFNLNDPFEKLVSDRLEEYLASGLPHDTILADIGRDFPYISNDIREKCENTAYVHYYSGKDGHNAASIKHVALLHSNSKDEPFHSHNGFAFHLNEGEDIYAAVMVENPLYLYEDANVHVTLHMEGEKVNEFNHTMTMGERRNIYYVPLNIQIEKSSSEGTVSKLEINIVNENIKGNEFLKEAHVYHGDKDPSEVFTLDKISHYAHFGGNDKDVLDLDELEFLNLGVSLDHSGYYGDISLLEGTVTLSPSASTDKSKDLIGYIYLAEPDGTKNNLEGNHTVFATSTFYTKHKQTPLYKPQKGKYTLRFFVLGALLWSREIEFIGSLEDTSDSTEGEEDTGSLKELSEWCDAQIKSLEKMPKPTSLEVPEPEVNPFEYIQVVGLNLYNVNNDNDDNDECLSNISAQPLTAFAADKLKMLSIIGRLKQIKETALLYRRDTMTWHIYDQTGRLVDSKPVKREDIQNEIWICAAFGDFCGQKWVKGSYRIELQWQSTTIITAVFTVGEIDLSSDYDPKIISRPAQIIRNAVEGSAIARLEKMAGLKEVKDKVHSLMNFHKLQKLRTEAGLPVKQPALHAQFLGNPGTGKTTVARLLGQIYKEMGLLSSGHVVLEERKNMIGRYYDSEGQAIENALTRAKGGILLIDEAYNLYVEQDEKDPGRRILEYLLTALSDENNRDWMLILAGYPNEMKKMLESNPGIESRVSEQFHFNDLDIDELVQIAELYCDDNKYELSEEARERLKSIITRDVAHKDKNFGNGRYVNKLMETAINTRMASRLSKIDSPTYDQLVTIEAEDIPISEEESSRISSEGFDDAAIDEALKRLDSLVGLGKVKSAIHNFVKVSRFLHSEGEKIRGKGLLKWNFTGNTGTGKSTVAKILADILKAMNLIQNSEITEIKGEEIFNVSDYECNEVIRGAVKKSRKGVLLIDGDAPEFRSSQYRMTSEQVRFKLAALASEDNASGALIISECTTPDLSIAHSLANNGIYDFDHTFIFDDYTENELYSILLQCLDKYKTTVSEEAEVILREYIRNLCANRELSFANARTMKSLSRSIFDTVILRMSQSDGQTEERVVLACDVDSFIWKRITKKIGF